MLVLLLFVAALIVGYLWCRRYERSARIEGMCTNFEKEKLVLTDAKTTDAQHVLGTPRIVVRKGYMVYVVSFDCVRGRCRLISSKIIAVNRVRLATDPLPLQELPYNRLVTWRSRHCIGLYPKANTTH